MARIKLVCKNGEVKILNEGYSFEVSKMVASVYIQSREMETVIDNFLSIVAGYLSAVAIGDRDFDERIKEVKDLSFTVSYEGIEIKVNGKIDNSTEAEFLLSLILTRAYFNNVEFNKVVNTSLYLIANYQV